MLNVPTSSSYSHHSPSQSRNLLTPLTHHLVLRELITHRLIGSTAHRRLMDDIRRGAVADNGVALDVHLNLVNSSASIVSAKRAYIFKCQNVVSVAVDAM